MTKQGIRAVAARIKILILDVDGVMTDGGLYYDHQGKITKRFNVQDGLGIKLAQSAGLGLAVMTGLSSSAVETRVRELGIEHYFHGFTRKLPLIQNLARDTGISCNEMAYLGDDWVDASPMLEVGLPMAVANAQPEIKNLAAWISSAPGGNGAVREAIMFILESRGDLENQWQNWISFHD
ncbi:KdsC family phosphatase [Desulfonatronovibrio hydrogenovorans]|uniref:KdsC family phosphatase n=1 Tax=Desulfonatronovibrio hydrogenovorans TaxID=53245 RepID=UPI00048F8239|nr:HAD-IIIA family hydrolase [Desulfonatronovibrio hydrogenovorans]